MKLTFALCAALVFAASCWARDIYVDNLGGNDRRDGSPVVGAGERSGPVQTIAKALRLALAGDRIVLANTGEPYRENVCLVGSRHSGSPVASFIIQGNGAVLDGSGPIPPDGWTYEAGDVFSYAPSRLGSQQLFLAGRPALRRPVARDAVTLPPLEPLEWCFWNGRIYFRVEQGKLPADYPLGCCRLPAAIAMYHVRDVVIQDLVIQGYQCEGISVADIIDSVRLERVTLRANGRSGIAIAGATRVELDQCSLYDNGEAQLVNDDFAQTRLYATQILPTTAPAIARRGGQIFERPQPLRRGAPGE